MPTSETTHNTSRTLVVIPNYNGLRFLPDCMEALSRQTVRDFTTLVIDNASGGEDITWLRTWQAEDPARRKLLLNDANLGFSGAVNQGIRQALEEHYEFTLLLNNDTKVRPDFIEALEKRMDQDQKGRVFALSSKMVKMHDPHEIDDAIARKKLSTLGITIDTLSEEQKAYLGI